MVELYINILHFQEEIIETEEDDELVGGEEDNLKMLRAKKEELKKKVEAKTLHQQNIQVSISHFQILFCIVTVLCLC